jgi:hypothetical protein
VTTSIGRGYEVLAGREDLERFLAEYALTEAGLGDRLIEQCETGPAWPRGRTAYLVHESVLRSDDDFPCAADRRAVELCRAIAADVARMFGISTSEAAERVNRQWSDPGPDGRVPRVWIVGGEDMVYHEPTEYWAEFIVERQRQDPGIAPAAPDLEPSGHRRFGSRDDLDRFLRERDLTEADVRDRLQVRAPYPGALDRTYYLPESVL